MRVRTQYSVFILTRVRAILPLCTPHKRTHLLRPDIVPDMLKET